MAAKVRWGVLGVAGIAVKKVIPAMQKGDLSEVVAIASRDINRAREAADSLNIARAHGSYEDLLADSSVDAIYNPLPNHLHVPWSIEAANAGKHVLCEKPISIRASDVKLLIEARNRTGVKIGEAFMVRTHPQWLRARELVRNGQIGELRAIAAAFSYFNRDPENIRNILELGGGAVMDIGCYPINISRFLFEREPARVTGLVERDPEMKTDRLSSAILDFDPGQAIFTCSTQLVPYQRVQILGTKARVEIEIPFNAPPDRPTRIFVDDGQMQVEEFPVCDQYTIQGDLFSKAILHGGEVPVPLEDALKNMQVIEALFRSGESGRWEVPGGF